MSWNGCIREGKMVTSTSFPPAKNMQSCLVPKHLQNYNNNTSWNQNSAWVLRAASKPTQVPMFNQPFSAQVPTPNQHFSVNCNLNKSAVPRKTAHRHYFYPSLRKYDWRPTNTSNMQFEFDTDSSESIEDLTDSEPMEIDQNVNDLPVETIDYIGEGASSNASIVWPRCAAGNLKSRLRVPSIHMKARHIYIKF